jgi:glycosyltransferase involved in cell wall biosynthesis
LGSDRKQVSVYRRAAGKEKKMNVHQFATSLSYGDAISDEMLEIQSVLRGMGHNSEIFIRFYEPRMAKYIHDFREYKSLSSPNNVVIFHFSIGSPVSKMFFRIPDKKIMIYHNITPYNYFLDCHRILTRECYKGRLEIKLFVDKVDLALGDSEYNRQELERLGYRNTGVLPLLLNLDKFDSSGDPVVRHIYDNGKWTVLFVGRVIPNKRFEDILKVFSCYKKFFNPDSQLILAVDFRELVSYFELANVYLSMSVHEGFGVPLLEAFHNRIPVVAFKAGAVEETMNGGGVLLTQKDCLRTAVLLDMIHKDRAFREDIVAHQLRALNKYSRENVSHILMSHIEQVSQS